MVPILDGISEIDAQSRLFDLLKALDREQSKIVYVLSKKDLISFMRAQHNLSYHLIWVPCCQLSSMIQIDLCSIIRIVNRRFWIRSNISNILNYICMKLGRRVIY